MIIHRRIQILLVATTLGNDCKYECCGVEFDMGSKKKKKKEGILSLVDLHAFLHTHELST